MQQPPTLHETLLNTDIEDLKITGEHTVPQWLHDPLPDAILEIVAISLERGGGSGSSGEGDEQR